MRNTINQFPNAMHPHTLAKKVDTIERWTVKPCPCSLTAELVDESPSTDGSNVKDRNPGLEANGGMGNLGERIECERI